MPKETSASVANPKKKVSTKKVQKVTVATTSPGNAGKRRVTTNNGSTHNPAEHNGTPMPAKTTLPRYSDVKLAEFKEILERRDQRERKELQFINELLNSNNEPGGFSEDGSQVSTEKENLNQQKARIITTLDNIQKALVRINDKSYGRCKTTNELIDERRLRIHPWATQSVIAKLQTAK